jgi:hypothetical protein
MNRRSAAWSSPGGSTISTATTIPPGRATDRPEPVAMKAIWRCAIDRQPDERDKGQAHGQTDEHGAENPAAGSATDPGS